MSIITFNWLSPKHFSRISGFSRTPGTFFSSEALQDCRVTFSKSTMVVINFEHFNQMSGSFPELPELREFQSCF